MMTDPYPTAPEPQPVPEPPAPEPAEVPEPPAEDEPAQDEETPAEETNADKLRGLFGANLEAVLTDILDRLDKAGL